MLGFIPGHNLYLICNFHFQSLATYHVAAVQHFNFKLDHFSCVLNNQHSMHSHQSRQPICNNTCFYSLTCCSLVQFGNLRLQYKIIKLVFT